MTPGAVGERARCIAAVRANSIADATAVRSALVAVREVIAWAVAQQAGLVARLAAIDPYPEASIAQATRESSASASRLMERSSTLAATPQLNEALEEGAITAGHVDAVTRASKQLPRAKRDELFSRCDALSGIAESSTIYQFTKRVKLEVALMQSGDGMDRLERQRRATRLRTWTDDDGMFCLNGRFDPLTGVALHARLDHVAQTLFAETVPDGCPDDPFEKQRFLSAHALIRLLTNSAPSLTGDRSRKPEYVVVIDADANDEPGPVVEWPIPIEVPPRVLAELMGDAEVTGVVVRNGVVLHAPGNLDLGRSTRLANRAQRRALRGLYRTCAIPGCGVAFDACKLHHITWWRNGGATDLRNLLPVCSKHHTNIHHDGWVIALGPNRELSLRLPNGTIHNTGPPNRRVA